MTSGIAVTGDPGRATVWWWADFFPVSGSPGAARFIVPFNPDFSGFSRRFRFSRMSPVTVDEDAIRIGVGRYPDKIGPWFRGPDMMGAGDAYHG